MIYKLETYDKKTFELTDAQYKAICSRIDSAKFIEINGVMVATGQIKELYPDFETHQERIQEKKDDLTELFVGNVAGFLTSGQISNQPKEIKLRLKRIWFEHIKERKQIDKRMAPLRLKNWEDWRVRANLPLFDARNRKPVYLDHQPYSAEEIRIQETPLKELMEDYEKSLT